MKKMNSFSFKGQTIGLLIGIFACLFCWGERKVKVTDFFCYFVPHDTIYRISGTPNFGSSLFAIIVIIILHKRKILNIGDKGKFTLPALLVDITILSTVLSLFMLDTSPDFLSRIFESTTLIVATTFFLTMVFFGMRGIARIAFVLYVVVWLYGTIGVISAALGFRGYLAILGFISCFYVQDMFCFDSIGTEFQLLYGKTVSTIRSTEDEIENIKSIYSSTFVNKHNDSNR